MLWIKALHIISMVSWFAGLFYLPRLFVYHAMAEDAISHDRFKIMERKLYYGIMTPAALATLIFGIALTVANWGYLKTAGWFHAKLFIVFILFGYHHACGRLLKKFTANTNTHSHIFYRWFNEIPVLFLTLIIILVIVKPF